MNIIRTALAHTANKIDLDNESIFNRWRGKKNMLREIEKLSNEIRLSVDD